MSGIRKSIAPVLGALIMVTCFGITAVAQEMNACREDVARFCKEVQPGGGRLLKCLKAHESDLSLKCRDSMAERQSKAGEMRDACADDVQRFCLEAGQGGGRIRRCLKENEERLSPKCRDTMRSMKGSR
jgi:hypothetical protein